jgi:thymidylate kinase
MAYYNKVINLNKVVVMSLKKSDLIKKKQHIEKHIKRNEIVISKRYVMANQICDPNRNFTEQKRCMVTWYELENMLLIKSELENLLKELDNEFEKISEEF